MKKFDTIFVLGGWLVQNADGSWRTTNFEEDDPKNAFGDRWRVDGVADLFDKQTAPVIVVSGSAGKLAALGAPAVAEVLARELVQIGVPQDAIIQDKESGSTYEQLQALLSLIKERQWNRIIILSNAYHLDRIEAMVAHAKPLTYLFDLLQTGNLVFKSAEEVLLSNISNKWKEVIDKARRSSRFKEIIAFEQKGVRDIKEGRYRFSFLRLRKAVEADTDFLFQLRNEKEVRESSWNSEMIPYETHRAWVSRFLVNPNRVLFIAEVDGVSAGQVRYDLDDAGKSAEASIAFLPEFRGKGFGPEALDRTAKIMFACYPTLTTLYAHIKPDNTGSVGSFAKVGYKKTSKTQHEGHPCIEMTKTC